MSRGPDAGTQLVRALGSLARRAGCPVSVASADWSRWASATFNGARHDIVLQAAELDALERWIAVLPEADLSARGMLVADVTITGVRRESGTAIILIEALTVEA